MVFVCMSIGHLYTQHIPYDKYMYTCVYTYTHIICIIIIGV